MANVLNHEKKQQILALGQLGWSLRRIQAATHVRRETISTYRKAAGLGVWPPGGWGRQTVSKPAIGVTTDFGVELSTPRPENQELVPGDSAKPAIEVTTGFGVELRGSGSANPGRNPSASACKPFQEATEPRPQRHGDRSIATMESRKLLVRPLGKDVAHLPIIKAVEDCQHAPIGKSAPDTPCIVLRVFRQVCRNQRMSIGGEVLIISNPARFRTFENRPSAPTVSVARISCHPSVLR
jgi:hypothetical protein